MENYQNKNKDKGNYLWLGVFAGVVVTVWALTTKNEVVEGLVFPLKVRLGLAQYKQTGFVSAKVASKENNQVKDKDRIKAKEVMEVLSNEILLSNKFPDVIGVGVIEEKNKPTIEVALLIGEDHTKIKEYLPSNDFSGVPIKFVEREQSMAL